MQVEKVESTCIYCKATSAGFYLSEKFQIIAKIRSPLPVVPLLAFLFLEMIIPSSSSGPFLNRNILNDFEIVWFGVDWETGLSE